MSSYVRIHDLASHQQMPDDGILTRATHEDANCKMVLFTMSAGQELSEHTASIPATMHFVSGQGDVTLASDAFAYDANDWVMMSPGLPHSIRARTPTTMLLTMFKVNKVPLQPKGDGT